MSKINLNNIIIINFISFNFRFLIKKKLSLKNMSKVTKSLSFFYNKKFKNYYPIFKIKSF